MDNLARDIVLIVDDSAETLSFLTQALEDAGLSVLVAVDGNMALEQMQLLTPDLVLLDAVMPGMDGFETCRRIKQNERFSRVPVIFMTGLAESEHVVAGLGAGGVDYVTKPVVIVQLLARIRVHLDNARAAHGTRVALDAAGRAIIAVRHDGMLGWYTTQAQRLLESLGVTLTPGSPANAGSIVAQWLGTLTQTPGLPTDAQRLEATGSLGRVRFTCIDRIAQSEYLVRLDALSSLHDDQALERKLESQFSLTTREGEVLLWLARGKANRDIADILSMSPRTVNKHLEHVFEKLGVENRTAAASLATKAMNA
jgi:DNA-binding response OmpR family regulator